MAAVSCSSSSDVAPSVFHPFERSEEVIEAASIATERCPLCRSTNSLLFCSNCVKTGWFYVDKESGKTRPLRFCSLQEKLLEDQKRQALLIRQIKELLRPDYCRDNALVHLIRKKRSLEQLRLSVDHKKAAKKKLEADLEATRKIMEVKILWQSKILKEKLAKATKHVTKMKAALQEKTDKLSTAAASLASARRLFIQCLTEFVFPLERVQIPGTRAKLTHTGVGMSVPGSAQVSNLVMDAASHTFVRGRWLYAEAGDDEHAPPYRIVYPRLPSSGDYSILLHALGHQCNESAAISALAQQLGIAVHEILAGLAYTNQLVNIIAKVLDVPLPHRISSRRFYCSRLTRSAMEAAICRLNHNIVYISCSQLVDSCHIHPLQTLHNVFALLACTHLGSNSPFLVNTDLLQSLEGHLSESEDEKDANTNEANKDQEGALVAAALAGSNESNDWESVCPELDAVPPPVTSASGLLSASSAAWNVPGINSSSIMSSVFQGVTSWLPSWRGGGSSGT